MAWTRRAVGAGLLAVSAAGAVAEPRPRPVVIAHRGASGERPEHTLAAYRLAIAQGADFIEPDLVVSRDGVLVCRHDTEIGATTDVAARPEFAGRRVRKVVDGVPLEGWFAEDFTLAELRTLRCRERIPQIRPANTAYDGQETIPTFQEVIDLVEGTGRRVGLYPELKHPTFLAQAGHDVVALLAAQLVSNNLNGPADPVFVQCFEVGPLEQLNALIGCRLIQLISVASGPFDLAATERPTSYASMATAVGLREIARYADGVGPEKALILPRDADGRSLPQTPFVADAHAAGLIVHPWTFRSENAFLPRELRRGAEIRAHGDAAAEYAAIFAAGVDGVFSDQPAAAVAARNRLATARL